jgi:hypothetical protein
MSRTINSIQRIVKLIAMARMKKKLHSNKDKKMILKLVLESGYERYSEEVLERVPKIMKSGNHSRCN